MVPWGRKILLEKWLERSGDMKLCLAGDVLSK